VTCIEAFNLIDTGASILGQVEDVDLAVAQNNSHADGGVPKAIDTATAVGDGIVRQTSAIQQQIKLPLKDASCCCAIGVVGQKDVVVSTGLRMALSSMDAPLIASVFRSDGQLGLQSSIRPR